MKRKTLPKRRADGTFAPKRRSNPDWSALWGKAKGHAKVAAKKATALKTGTASDLFKFMVDATYTVPSPYPRTAARLKAALDSLKKNAANGDLDGDWRSDYADWFGEDAEGAFMGEIDERHFSKAAYRAAGRKYVEKLIADGFVKVPNSSKRRPARRKR
jgi:hypothetical protein